MGSYIRCFLVSVIACAIVGTFTAVTGASYSYAKTQSNNELASIETRINKGDIKNDLLESLAAIIDRDERNARAHFLAGRAYEYLGFRELAFNQYEIANKLDRRQGKAILELFRKNIEAQDFASALNNLPYLEKAFPNDSAVLFMQGLELQHQERWQEAQMLFEKALKQE